MSGSRCNNNACNLAHDFKTSHNKHVFELNKIYASDDLLLKFYLVRSF